METARWLCNGLNIAADIRCEDATATTFNVSAFDLVFSCGLIEHFEDPSEMIEAHIQLLAPGGTAVIAIPNYSGIYRRLQEWCDPENLKIHNLQIMNEVSLLALTPDRADLKARAFHFGRFSPWLISLPAKLGNLGKIISWGLNFVARLQSFEIKSLSPLLVLEVRREKLNTYHSPESTKARD